MSLEGKAEASGVLRGKINLLDILCISAYGIAVKNGFEGTEAEWLESLKAGGSPVRVSEITLLANKWAGTDNLHFQIVGLEGLTERSQVNLTPDVEQLVVFYEKDLTFVTKNYSGTLYVYAIGQKPMNDYTIQVTITEVNV